MFRGCRLFLWRIRLSFFLSLWISVCVVDFLGFGLLLGCMKWVVFFLWIIRMCWVVLMIMVVFIWMLGIGIEYFFGVEDVEWVEYCCDLVLEFLLVVV